MSAFGSESVDLERPAWLTQMETVLEVLNEGVVIFDDRNRILFVNSQFVGMTGIPRNNLIGFDAVDFYSTAEKDFLLQQIDVGLRAGHDSRTLELPMKDGRRLPVIANSRIIENSGHKCSVVTFTDISEQVQAEDELRSANLQLQKRQMEIEEDLRLAASVQKSLAPKSMVWDTISVDSFYHTVHTIGGDFALVNSQDQQCLNLLVCDVSGHGIGSALVANRIYTETTAHLGAGMPFLEMFDELNRFLIEDIPGSGMFATLVAARIDAQKRSMVFAGAGHPPAMLARKGQAPMLLESRYMVLGALTDTGSQTVDIAVQLQPDDRLVLYTDGITEVFNSRGEMLDVEGLQEIVRQSSTLPAHEMKNAILDGVSAWREGPPTDDISLVVVHIR